MILRYSQLATEIEEPTPGFVSFVGFISPKGEVFGFEEEDGIDTHKGWIEKYADWLEKEGYTVRAESGQTDELRDSLVEQGWVHIFTPELISVYTLTPSVRKTIVSAYRMGYINKEEIEEGVSVVEVSSGKTLVIPKRELGR